MTRTDEPVGRKVVAIIQARMGSQRFPGKVLADLRGRPVLEWVVDRVRQVEFVDEVVVATTTNSEDTEIQDWCLSNGVNCFRGEPLDVLARYLDCAKAYRATHVLRITADCPLLHPRTVSTVLLRGMASGADYFGLDGEFPDGFDCEGFSVEALERANTNATNPHEREHVTAHFKSNPGTFRTEKVQLFVGKSDVRLTIDFMEDLELVAAVLQKSGGKADNLSQLFGFYRQVVKYYRR